MTRTQRISKKNRNLIIILFLLAILSTGFVLLRKFTNIFDKFLGAYQVKVSVIVPVYNTEGYLDECLNSLQNQTFRDIEIICVNDGATDRSPEILKEHERWDKRIKIINQENKGVSAARNKGIENARGDYIMFLDSDDAFVPYACEKAYNVAANNEVNVAEFGVKNFTDGEAYDLNGESYDDSKIIVRTKKENENPFGALDFSCGVIWNKIWKKSFIEENNLKFKEGIYRGEDSLFNMLAGTKLDKFVKDDNVLHFYRTGRPGSTMTVTQTNIKKKLDSFLIIIKELADNRDEFSFDDSDQWLLSHMLWMVKPAIFDELDDYKEKLYYCERSLNIIEEDFLKKYDIWPPMGSENEYMLSDMQKFILYRID